MAVAQSVGDWAEKPQFKPRWRPNIAGVLAAGGARTSLQHCRDALEQDTEPPNAHIVPCNKLGSHSGVYPAFAYMQPDRVQPHQPRKE